ncbi:hypothetical protein L596_009436 [Steinernema carpocapsae]|uniref:Uncharacterized protein n=1 Tax=Steinernema carpocapsae TaxID=34508 RepID=A0A4U5PFC2_STECR|nr:hypothetical protein L596_009436 [Steinernema carpocapsae]
MATESQIKRFFKRKKDVSQTSANLNDTSWLRKELKRRIKEDRWADSERNRTLLGAVKVTSLFYVTNLFMMFASCWQMLDCSLTITTSSKKMCYAGLFFFVPKESVEWSKIKLTALNGVPMSLLFAVLIFVGCTWACLLALIGARLGLKQIRTTRAPEMRPFVTVLFLVPFYMCVFFFYLVPAMTVSVGYLVQQAKYFFFVKNEVQLYVSIASFVFASVLPMIVLWLLIGYLVVGLAKMGLLLSFDDRNSYRAGNMSAIRNSGFFASTRGRTPHRPNRSMTPLAHPLSNVTWPSLGNGHGSAQVNNSFESPRSRYSGSGRAPRTPRLRMPLTMQPLDDSQDSAGNLTPQKQQHVVVNVEESTTPTKQSLRERGDQLMMMGGYSYGNGTPSRRFLETVVEEEREIEGEHQDNF